MIILPILTGMFLILFFVFLIINILIPGKRLLHLTGTMAVLTLITFFLAIFSYPNEEEVKSEGFKFPQENNKPTYQVEIINQDSVYVLTDTGKVKTHIDSIGKTITKDNL